MNRPKPIAVRPPTVAASERLEDPGQHVRRNRRAAVLDLEHVTASPCCAAVTVTGVPSPLLNRIADEIGHDLGESVRVPVAAQIPAAVRSQWGLWVTVRISRSTSSRHGVQVGVPSRERNRVPQSRACDV
jgi:hypothetical protein